MDNPFKQHDHIFMMHVPSQDLLVIAKNRFNRYSADQMQQAETELEHRGINERFH